VHFVGLRLYGRLDVRPLEHAAVRMRRPDVWELHRRSELCLELKYR
jgi:hypothetical protein